MKTNIIIVITMFSLMFGCLPQSKIVVVTNKKILAKSISTLAIINNQLIINGNGLDGTQTIKIQGTSFDESFTVESASNTQIVANAQRAISIGANQVFDLIISNASASATFPITITLDNGSVTAPKLASMGAGVGQVLQYNGTSWVPASISTGQLYMGTWNASTDTPDITASSPQAGEYYIVTTTGTQNLGGGAVVYSIGDWVIYNGSTWDKIAISNNTVASFNGRSGVVVPASGDYTWSQITKTGSKLEDIQTGFFNIKTDARITFDLNRSTKTISNVIGHVYVQTPYAEAHEEISTENSYMGFFQLASVSANPNYRPIRYIGHTQFKNFDAAHTAGQEDGMWGSFVVDLNTAPKFHC